MTVIVDIRKRHAKKALLIVYKAHQNYEISNGYAYNAKLYIYIYIYIIYTYMRVCFCASCTLQIEAGCVGYSF